MDLLWTLEDLKRWSKNPDPNVRTWVIHSLKRHYPEQAGAIMVSLLEDSEEPVAAQAAAYFSRRLDPQYAEALLAPIRHGRAFLFGPCALALAKIGDDRFVPILSQQGFYDQKPLADQMEVLRAMAQLKKPEAFVRLHAMLEHASAVAESEDKKAKDEVDRLVSDGAHTLLASHLQEEIIYLLRYYLNSPHQEAWGYLILEAFVFYAGASYAMQELEGETQRKKLSRLSSLEKAEISTIESCGNRTLAQTVQKLLAENKSAELISLLHEEAEAIYSASTQRLGEPALFRWEKAERPPLLNLRLLRALSGELPRIGAATKSIQRRLAITALITYSRLLQLQQLLGRSIEELSAEEKMALLLQDRDDFDFDEASIRLLCHEEVPSHWIQACHKMIKNTAHPAMWRAAELLGNLRHVEAIPDLFSVLETENDFLWTTVRDALSKMGEPVLPFIEKIVREEKEDETRSVISLLGFLPFPRSVEIILSHFPRLYQIDGEMLLGAMEDLGSPRFIPLLKEIMRPGELEEEVFLLLCHLNEINDPALPRVERAVASRQKEAHQRMSRLLAGDERAWLKESIPLKLECLRCQRSYTYDVHDVLVDPDSKKMEDIYLRDLIVCKGKRISAFSVICYS